MKKITLSLVFLIIAISTAIAQDNFSFGPKIGVDYTHFWGKNSINGGKISYQIGAFFEKGLSNKFAIAPEIVFASQGPIVDGAKILSNTDILHTKNTYHLNYINIPIIFKYYVTTNLSIDFGPQIGINVYGKCTMKDENDISTTVDANAKKFDFGLGLGATYNFTEKIFIQARYTMGLTEAKKYLVLGFFKVEEKNGNAQISIGYRF